MAKVMTEEQIAARRERIARRAGRPPTRVKVPQEVYVKQGKITGRPSLKTPAVMDEIIAGVAAGRSLANVCKDNESLPDVRNVYRWMDQDEGFRLRYLRACANRSLVYADTIGDIAHATIAGRVDTYGERQEVTVNHQHLHLHALQQLSAAAKAGQAAILQREAGLQVMHGDDAAQTPTGGPDGGGRLLQQQPLLTDTISPTETPATLSYPATSSYPATPETPEAPETEQQPPVTG